MSNHENRQNMINYLEVDLIFENILQEASVSALTFLSTSPQVTLKDPVGALQILLVRQNIRSYCGPVPISKILLASACF